MRCSSRCLCAFAALALLSSGVPVVATARPVILEEVAKLNPPGPDDQLVVGVGVSGNHLVFNTRRNFQSGSDFLSEQFAYLYTRDRAGDWTHTATLSSVRHPHQAVLRMSASVYGDIAAVHVGQPSGGELTIFERTGSRWVHTASIGTNSEGRDMEMDGGRILLSGPGCSSSLSSVVGANQAVQVQARPRRSPLPTGGSA
jgi:hypothetical protein